MIPNFVDGYHLPSGEHESTFKEVEDRFGKSTPERVNVWKSFKSLVDRLVQLNINPDQVLIDGSFVTGREKPEDVDFAALFDASKVDVVLRSSNVHDKSGITLLLNENNQIAIRDLFGTHMLVAYDQNMLDGWSLLFRKGIRGTGLRSPDPDRDPSWVERPKDKGIIKVFTNQTIQGDGEL